MDCDNLKTAIEAGKELAAEISDVDGLPIARIPSGWKVEVLERALVLRDERSVTPRALVGTANLTELDSFIGHVNRFKDERSAVFASVIGNPTLTCIFDYHNGPGDPRWGRHRAVYVCPLSDEWKAWTKQNDKTMDQDDFSSWIEDHLADLGSDPSAKDATGATYPSPLAVLEVARNLVIHNRGIYERKVNPSTGEGILVVKDEHETSSTKIPRAFLLGIPVFVGGARYAVEARMRFSLQNGRPLFSYSLYRAAEVLRLAFTEARGKVSQETALPLFAGSPEGTVETAAWED